MPCVPVTGILSCVRISLFFLTHLTQNVPKASLWRRGDIFLKYLVECVKPSGRFVTSVIKILVTLSATQKPLCYIHRCREIERGGLSLGSSHHLYSQLE